MSPLRRYILCTAAVALSAASVNAQSVISAKSGLIHYVEGDVSLNGTPVEDKAGVFADMKKDGELTTALGRAEVLLTPGVLLRVGEQSAVKMQDNSLQDTRVEFESGTIMVESDTPMKDNVVTVVYKDYSATFKTHGLFEFQSEPAQLRVYSGEAEVNAGGQMVIVKEGHALVFTAALAQEKFNPKEGDALFRWSKLRSEYLSVANVSAAKSARDSGLYGGNGFGSGGWVYNPLYSMYTYLPFSGMAFSPFGFGYYSPYTVYRFYNGYNGGNSGFYGGSGGSYSSGSTFTRASGQSSVAAAAVSNSGYKQNGGGTVGTGGGGVAAGGAGGAAGGGGHAGGHGH